MVGTRFETPSQTALTGASVRTGSTMLQRDLRLHAKSKYVIFIMSGRLNSDLFPEV